jgi:hypothetical protein
MQKLDHCHNNPIKRGLIERPEQWPGTSYAHYEGGAMPLLKMDWDGGWPLA